MRALALIEDVSWGWGRGAAPPPHIFVNMYKDHMHEKWLWFKANLIDFFSVALPFLRHVLVFHYWEDLNTKVN